MRSVDGGLTPIKGQIPAAYRVKVKPSFITLAAYLNALSGKRRLMWVTVNDQSLLS